MKKKRGERALQEVVGVIKRETGIDTDTAVTHADKSVNIDGKSSRRNRLSKLSATFRFNPIVETVWREIFEVFCYGRRHFLFSFKSDCA